MEEEEAIHPRTREEVQKLDPIQEILVAKPLVVVATLIVLFLSTLFLLIYLVSLPDAAKQNEFLWKCPEVTQAILSAQTNVWKSNRQQFLTKYFTQTSGILYLVGGQSQTRNSDQDYPFRQDSFFLYLTGVNEPNVTAVIDLSTKDVTVFVPMPTSYEGIWIGYVPSLEELTKQYNVDKVLYHENETDFFVSARTRTDLIFLLNEDVEVPQSVNDTITQMGFTVNSTAQVQEMLASCRLVKTAEELTIIQHVSDISSNAHKAVMSSVRPGLFEYQMAAVFEAALAYCGSQFTSYDTIAASGNHSAYLHYSANTSPIADGDLFLLDAGGEFTGYATDITRTFPSNGKFSSSQSLVYQMVLDAQLAGIQTIRSGIKWRNVSEAAVDSLLQSLLKHKFVTGDLASLKFWNVSRVFLPHGIGHMVGLDVHDPVERSETMLDVTLETGMVVTVEPGMYFTETSLALAQQNSNITAFINWPFVNTFRSFGGVRIEDTLLVTATGSKLISSVPKTIAEVETLVQQSKTRQL